MVVCHFLIGFLAFLFLSQECKNLKEIFLKLKYPEKLINSAINYLQQPKDPVQTPSDSPVRITLPFKHQKSADVVRRQLGDLGTKINQQLQPVFTSKKIAAGSPESHRRKASLDQPAKCSIRIHMCFVRYDLYWIHLPPSPSTRRGT